MGDDWLVWYCASSCSSGLLFKHNSVDSVDSEHCKSAELFEMDAVDGNV